MTDFLKPTSITHIQPDNIGLDKRLYEPTFSNTVSNAQGLRLAKETQNRLLNRGKMSKNVSIEEFIEPLPNRGPTRSVTAFRQVERANDYYSTPAHKTSKTA